MILTVVYALATFLCGLCLTLTRQALSMLQQDYHAMRQQWAENPETSVEERKHFEYWLLRRARALDLLSTALMVGTGLSGILFAAAALALMR